VDSYVSGDGLQAAAYRRSSVAIVVLLEDLISGKVNTVIYHF
jgi:hypothetical protein